RQRLLLARRRELDGLAEELVERGAALHDLVRRLAKIPGDGRLEQRPRLGARPADDLVRRIGRAREQLLERRPRALEAPDLARAHLRLQRRRALRRSGKRARSRRQIAILLGALGGG